MIWQDLVFLTGSMLSVAFLYPTLRDAAARVPRATSVPSMVIGGAYSMTFFTLGMTFSGMGSLAACTMWSLIATFRAPEGDSLVPAGTAIPTAAGVRAAADRRYRRLRRRYGGSGGRRYSSPARHRYGGPNAPSTDGFDDEIDISARPEA